ncbi:hydrogenase [Legionella norrlandica]|uniref:Hydrogenase n=1 Tax=Legionella norrlandica TaxID=1498499 RepID=A0A0A2SQE7_9GAMM|nr:hydrogenase maturation protease [Legionella norrlandica]KGP63355.1 hydrogenase [Legionella norrlandica]
MSFIKILGIGSPFGDDQVGWLVAEGLKKELDLSPDIDRKVSVECHDRPGLRLIELLDSQQVVFLIDAVKSGGTIGTIHHLKNSEIYTLKNALSTHAIGVVQALQLANSLDVLPEHIILYGIEIGDATTFPSTLSKSIEKTIPLVIAQLKRELDCFLEH